MTQLTASDIALLAKQKAHVVHCPTSNLKLAAGFCPVSAAARHLAASERRARH